MSDLQEFWRDVRTTHLVSQVPLTRDQVDGILSEGFGKEKDYEERMPGMFWHSSFPPFPEGWECEVDGKPHGPECVTEVCCGRTLRCPAAPAPCDYVRVCDHDGSELVYWDKQEWADDPAEVMGAIIGAMRG